MADPDIQNGGGRGFGHPDPEIRGCLVPSKFFGPSGLSFVYKEGRLGVGGGVGPRAPPVDPPLDYSFEALNRRKTIVISRLQPVPTNIFCPSQPS